MTFESAPGLREALETLGDLLEDRGLSYTLLTAGGGSLMLQRFGSLTLHLLGRQDQIALKLYATADTERAGKHAKDLEALHPTADELAWAARWVRTHDPSEGFRSMLARVLNSYGLEAHDVEL